MTPVENMDQVRYGVCKLSGICSFLLGDGSVAPKHGLHGIHPACAEVLQHVTHVSMVLIKRQPGEVRILIAAEP